MLKKDIYPHILIIIVCFLIYGNTINHDFVLDDKIVLKDNRDVQRGFAAIPSIFSHTTDHGYIESDEGTAYRPLTLTSFAIEVGIFGLNPGVHHFFNVLLYALLCVLIFLLLTKFLFPGKHKLFSLMITLLFLIHPLHTEVVSNIKSRDEILSFLFLVISIILLFRYLDYRRIYILILSIVSYTLALFSKENGIVFILVIPLFIYYFRKTPPKDIFRIMLPYILMLSFFLVVRQLVVSGRGIELSYTNNAILAYDGFFERYFMVFYILLLYLKLLIFPYPLIWDYSYGHFEMSNTMVVFGIISFIIYLSMFIYALAGFKKKNIFSFSILFYLLTLSVASNVFIFIGSTMSERFLFIPSFGFCLALIVLIEKTFNVNFRSSKLLMNTGLSVALILVFLVVSGYTYAESKQWKDDYTLTISDYGKARSFRARMSYVENIYRKAHEISDNREIMKRARIEMQQILNDFPEEANAWYLNGLIDMAYSEQKAAIKSYKKTLEINKRHFDAMNNLGTIYHKAGDYQKALQYYNQILENDSSYFRVYGNIGMIYHYLKDYEKAIMYYRLLLKYDPDDERINRNLEMAERELGDLKI